MAERVELAFGRALREVTPRGSSVLAAVSGGGDSIALLHLLARMAPRLELRVAVAHLDHGLRPDSHTDLVFVSRVARSLGLRCISDRREVGRLRRADESPEEAARRVRRAFLLEAAERLRCDCVALGHTLDDQAETVLMRLVRGAGPSALTGMTAEGPGPVVRPLLTVTRGELRGWLDRQRLEFRNDESNGDLRFDRNRVRHRVLPLLAEALNPRAARHLVQAAERLRDDAALLDAISGSAYEAIVRAEPDGGVRVAARELAGHPRPIAQRIARRMIARAGSDTRRIGSRHVQALVDLTRGSGSELHLPSGVLAYRRNGTLYVTPPIGGVRRELPKRRRAAGAARPLDD